MNNKLESRVIANDKFKIVITPNIKKRKFKLIRNACVGLICSMFVGFGNNYIANKYTEEKEPISANFDITQDNFYGISSVLVENTDVEETDNDIYLTSSELDQTESINLDQVFTFDNLESKYDSEIKMRANMYNDIFVSMGNTYGIDSELLNDLMCQESGGIHNSYSQNGLSIGGMQIALSNIGHNITAFNYDTNSYETITVDGNLLGESFEYNCKVSCFILQNYIVKYNYDIPKAVQAYNFGDGNVDKLGDDWFETRDHINGGDPIFIENVFKFSDTDTILSFKKEDGSTYNLEIINDYDNVKVYTI